MESAKDRDFRRVSEALDELSAQVVALTAVVGGIVTAAVVDYERLEECVNFAADKLRPGSRPILLVKAAAVLEGFEKMQRLFQIESRKKRGLRGSPATPGRKRPSPRLS